MRFPAAGESCFCKRLIISVVSDSAEVRINAKQCKRLQSYVLTLACA